MELVSLLWVSAEVILQAHFLISDDDLACQRVGREGLQNLLLVRMGVEVGGELFPINFDSLAND